MAAPSRRRRPPRFEEIEPRLLYAADMAALSPVAAAWALPSHTRLLGEQPLAADPVQQALDAMLVQLDSQPLNLPATEPKQGPTQARELLVVDADITDLDGLLAGLRGSAGAQRELQVLRLDPGADALAQITQALAGQQGLAALHIVSHASTGALRLAGQQVDASALASQAAALQAWGRALDRDADILLYGCDLASDQSGQALLRTLADLTGADVAASTNATGSAALGGDWTLEAQVGLVDRFTLSATDWQGTLATFTVNSTADTGAAGTLRWAINQANTNAGADTINFNIALNDPNHLYYRDNGVAGTFAAPVATTLADAAIADFDADYLAGTARSWYSIALSGNDLQITQALVIDGSTQAGYSASKGPIIEINAAGVTAGDPNAFTIQTSGVTIRGLAINRAPDDAIEIDAFAGGHTIVGNYIGTDVSGLRTTYGNGYGITVKTDGNTIGGTSLADRNVIAGNSTLADSFGIGFYQDADNNVVQGNYIGVGADGTTPMSNRDGVIFAASQTTDNNLVGGAALGAGNLIAGNSLNGITALSGTGNAFIGNNIYSNGLLGINLGTAGVTANDTGDGDSGANNLQNFPVLGSVRVVSGTQLAVTGTLNSTASSYYRVEFFASTSADATGYGEGQRYLGFVNVSTDGSGNAAFSTTLTATLAAGETVSATATKSNATFTTFTDTSEFAQNTVAFEGMALWRTNADTSPNLRVWDGTAFSPAGSSTAIGDLRSMQSAEAPTRNEVIVIGRSTAGSIIGEIWNGSTWSALPINPLGSYAASSQWIADVAYESYSGDAMLAWADGTGLKFATWNGSTWSAANLVSDYAALSGGTTATRVSLASSPSSNEMVLAVTDNVGQDYAFVWNGSAWGGGLKVSTNASGRNTASDVAYEATSGHAMIVYEDSGTGVAYRTWNGSSWSAAASLAAPAGVTGFPNFLSLAADPTSDRLSLAVSPTGLAGSVQYWLATWSGSTWGSPVQAAAAGIDQLMPGIDVAFEGTSGEAVAAYGVNGSNLLRYRTWSAGGGWSAEQNGPALGAAPRVVTLTPERDTDRVMLLEQDANADLYAVQWNGGSWGPATVLETNTGETNNQPFDFVWSYTKNNAAPVHTVPGPQTTNEDTPLVFSVQAGNLIAIADDSGANPIQLTLTATNGTVTLSETLGPEQRVNTTVAGNQKAPDVAVASDGSHVVVWQSQNSDGNGSGIVLQRFGSDGTALGGEVVVNTTALGNQTNPAIAMAADGSFVVVWESKGQDNLDNSIGLYGQRFNAAGAKVGAEFQVNSTTLDDQKLPDVAMDAVGNFVVTWQSKGQDNADLSTGIYAQRFNAAAAKQGGEFRVNTTTLDNQVTPTVSMSSGGAFVVAWQSKGHDNPDGKNGVFVRLYNAAGAAQTGEVVASQTTAGEQKAPVVGMDDSGKFVVAWQSTNQDGSRTGVYARQFSAAGAASGSEFLVNTTVVNDQNVPVIAVASSGEFAIAWQSKNQDGSAEGVYIKQYDASGVMTRGETRVNTTTAQAQRVPALGIDTLGRVVTVWTSNRQDGANEGVYAQRLLPVGAVTYLAGDGTQDAVVTIRATMDNLNAVLDGLVFEPTPDFSGTASLQITTNDLGHSGQGGALSDSDTITINVLPFNDAPRHLIPALQTATEGTPLVFSSAAGNAITIADDAAPGDLLRVSLSAGRGTLSLASTAGLSFTTGDGTADAALVFTGTLANINAALNGMSLLSADTFTGLTFLRISTDDLGSSGSGAAGQDADTVLVNIVPDGSNAAPVNTVPPTQYNPVGTTLGLSGASAIWLTDDSANNPVTLALTATDGTVTLNTRKAGEARVNTTTLDEQLDSQIAMAADGRFVIVWTSKAQDDPDGKTGIYAQRFDVFGQAEGAEFLVNATTADAQTLPSVAMDASGNFVVVWDSNLLDGEGSGIFGQRFDAGGARLGGEFQINTEVVDDQTAPAVAMDDSGRFVVVWQSKAQDNADGRNGVYAQLFDTAGMEVGDEFLVNTFTLDEQLAPAVAMDADGDFVVVWQSKGQDGGGVGIYAQRYDAAGVAQGGEFLVNQTTAGDQTAPAVAMDDAGNFVVAWVSNGQDGSGTGVYARRFASSGIAQGAEFRANTTIANDQFAPTLARDADGDFIIGWQGSAQDGSGEGVFAQRYNADGSANGGEFRVNTTTSNDQTAPAVAMSAAGDLVFTWTSRAQDNADGREGVYLQRFTKNNAYAYTTGDGTADALIVVSGTIADLNLLLDGATFTPTVGFNGTATLQVAVNDQGYSGSGGALTDSDTIELVFNDAAPVLDAAQSPSLNDQPSGTGAPVGAVGTLVSALVDFASPAGQLDNVSDADASPLLGIAVTATDSANGSWWYSINGGSNWSAMGGVSNASARLLAADASTRLYFQPNVGYAGTMASAITFRAWDRSGGANGALANTSTSGGITPFSAASDSARLFVGTNTAPINTVPAAQSTDVNGLVLFSSATGTQISVADADAGSNAIQVNLTATNGTVNLSGNKALAFTVGDGAADATMTFTGSVADINAALNGMTFTATAGFVGTAGLQITTDDLGYSGTGGARSDTDTVSIAVREVDKSIWIASVNDVSAPGATGLANWTAGQVLKFGPNAGSLLFEPGATTGTFSLAGFNLDSLSFGDGNTQIDALQYVTRNFTVGGVALQTGDLLFSTAGNETIGGVAYEHGDILLFRPTTAGNYSAGTFSLFFDRTDIALQASAFALVEQTVVVGDVTLDAGDLLLCDNGSRDILRFVPTQYGNTTAGTSSVLIDGDGNLGFGQNIGALAIVDQTTVVGNTTLSAGTLIVSLVNEDASVGSGTQISVTRRDLFTLNVTSTGVGTTSATATLLFQGADVGLDNNNEAVQAVTLIPNQGPALGNQTFGVPENSANGTVVGTVTGTDPEASTLRYAITSGNLNGAFTINATTGQITVANSAALDFETTPVFTLGVAAIDADGAYGTATVTVNLSNVNDAPALDASRSPALSAISEDASSPVGAVGTLVSALVDSASPAGQLDNVTDGDAGAQLGVAVTGADSTNGSWWYSTNNGSSWNALGVVSNASARLLFADGGTRLYFQPNANWNGTVANALTFRAWDRSDALPNASSGVNTGAGGGTSAFSAATDSASLVVNAVNDAPVLDNTGTMVLNNVQQDSTNPAGTSVAALIASAGGNRITDVDAGAAEGIAITSRDNSNGTWEYSVDGGVNWLAMGNLNGSQALVLSDTANDLVRFVPGAGFSGSAAITFRAWDRSDGLVSGTSGVNTNTNGGATPFSSATQTASVYVEPLQVLLWMTTSGDVSGSGVPGLSNWTQSTVLTLGDPGLSIGTNTAGRMGTVTNFDNFGSDVAINGLHFVNQAVTLNGAGIVGAPLSLVKGDMLFVTTANETLSTAAASPPTGWASSISVTAGDVYVFRPATAGDYSSGYFRRVMAGPGANATRDIALVEKPTTVGGTSLASGDLLFTQAGNLQQNNIYWYRAATNTATQLVAGTDIGIPGGGTGAGIDSLDLVQRTFTSGGFTFQAGDVLVGFNKQVDGVGSGGSTVTAYMQDLVRLRFTATTFGAGTAVASAATMFDGADVKLDTASENLAAVGLLVQGAGANVAPAVTLPGAALAYTEGAGAVIVDATATVSDVDSPDLNTGALRVDLTVNGTPDDRLAIRNQGTGNGQIGVSGSNVTYNFGAGAVTIGTFAGGTDGSTPLLVTLNANATPAAVQALLRNVTYENVSNNPSPAPRTLRVLLSDGDGATSSAVGKTINVTNVNSTPVAVNDAYSVNEDTTLVVAPTTANLANLWRFNEGSGQTVTSGGSLGSGGTLGSTGGVDAADPTWTTGYVGGSALAFNGAGQYVDTTSTDLKTASSFTLSTWFKTNSTATTQHLLWQGYAGGNGYGSGGSTTPDSSEMSLSVGSYAAAYNNRIVFSLGYDVPANGADSIFIASASDFTDTTRWHHVAVTVSDIGGGVMRASLYVDGKLEGTDTGSQNDRSVWETLRIGAPGDGSRSFNGQIDEVRIYASELTGAQVQAIAQGGVLANDSDIDGPRLQVNTAVVTGPANGTLSIQQDGSFTYTPNANFNGVDSFTYRANDGTADSNAATVTITVNAVNDPPVNTVPGGQYTPFNTALVFSSANGNPISITDADAAASPVQVTLTVGNGTLTLAGTAGITFTGGANGSATMSFTGTVASINTALNGLSYSATTNYRGPDTLQIATSDLGNTGSGGTLTDTDSVRIYAGALVVTNTSDTSNGNTASIGALVANDGGDGISLREAIVAANNTANGASADRIIFDIAGAGPHMIALASALPTINEAVVVDGSTEPDYVSNAPVVRIDGAGAGAAVNGITIGASGGGSTIRGLIITRFSGDGINVASGANGVTIAGNWIGTTGAGSTGVGNADDGIDIAGSSAIIGGTGANDRNVITNSGDEGINIAGSGITGHVIQGNYIGVDPDGASGGGNVDVGIAIISGTGNTIGGTTVAARNVISMNWEGMEINTANNTIQGNYIGTDASGTLNRGNRLGDGIQIQGSAANTVVGGTTANAANLIAYNAGDGVSVLAGSGHRVLGNLTFGNAGLGIDLGTSGVTANDAGDGDSGANNLQNFPVLTSANSAGGNTTIVGTLDSTANTTLRIEFFSSATGDGSGHGEGLVHLGFTTVTTDGSGNASINAVLNGVTVTAGHVVSATATVDLGGGNYGSTSEFAANVVATNIGPGITVGTISGSTSEAGGTATFTVALNTAPTANVTIAVSSSNTLEGTVSTSLLTFTGANWNVAQTVTVTGVDDSRADGNAAYTVLLAPATSTDGSYSGLDAADVAVTNIDNDSASITVTPVSVSALGGETRVNTTTGGDQNISANVNQAIATDANGNFVVVWASDLQDGALYGIYGQRFSADGTALGSEFLVNTTTADSQILPSVAMDAAGNFVVTWSSDNQDGSGYGVYAQRYDSAGVAQGGEFRVHTTTTGGQIGSQIAMSSGGAFVIVWSSAQDPDASSGIYGQRYDAAGVAQGGEFRVNTYTVGTQQLASVAMSDSGSFVVTWASDGQDGSGNGVYGQLFAANGAAQGSEFRVNTTTANSQLYHDVAMLADGRFVVVYQSRNADNTFDVYLQRYAANGTAIDGETPVNTTTVSSAQQPIASVSADAGGNITVVWNSAADGSGTGIVGRRFSWNGSAIGAEFQVNSTTGGNQLYPEVVSQPGGRFIVAWYGNGTGDADGVFFQRYGLATTEAGTSATFQVGLTSQPTADVTITIGSGDATEGTVSPTTLTFTPANWNVLQTVTVSGLQDFVNDGDVAYTVVTAAATSSDINYSGLNAANVSVTNREIPNVAPVNSVPAAQSVNEDGTLVFSSGTGNLISIGDADAGSNAVRVTLTGTNGTLTLSGTSGLSFTVGDGAADATMTFTGSVASINAALAGMSFGPAANFNGAASLQIVTNDLGNTGTGGALGDTDTVAITVNPVNDAPTGAPVVTGTLTEDQVLGVDTSSIADADGLGAFSYQWQRDGVNIGGATGPTYTLGDADVATNIRVVVSYTDGQGTAESLASTAVGPVANVNDAPTGAPVVTGTPTEDQTLSADTSAIADADGLGAFSYQWTRNGTNIAGATANSYALGDADVGTLIRVVVSYTDGQGTPENLTSAPVGPIANVNDAPGGVVTIDDTTPTQGQLLSAANTLSDADGLGPITYQWQRNGVDIAGATGAAYTTTQADVGQLLRVVASYTDGHSTPESVASADTAAVANLNDAPSGAPVINGTATEDQTLSADTSAIADADGLGAFSYQWTRNGTNIAGATAATYTLGDADVGTLIRVVVSYTDGQGTPENLTSAPVGPIANVNDAPTGTPAVSGITAEDQTLTADTSGIADADGLGAFSYQWLRSTDGGTTWSNVGANAATYVLGDADVGAVMRVNVSYTDGQGTSESLSSAQTALIANVNDAPSGAPVNNGTPTEDQTLSADTSAIADADGLGAFSYQWQRDGVAVAGATASTYVLGDADVGRQISVQVNYTDGNGTAERLTSAPTAAVANVNDTPTITSGGGGAAATFTVPENNTAVTTVSASDVDGPALSFAISGGADASRFSIDASTGELSFLTSPDHENPTDADADNVYDVVVQVNDGAGGTDTQSIAVRVVSVNEAPVFTLPAAAAGLEDTALPIPGLSVTDADGNLDGLTLSVGRGRLVLDLSAGAVLAAGTNGGPAFTLVGNQEQLNAALASLVYLGDRNFNGADTLTLVAHETGGPGAVATLGITLAAVNDAPTMAAGLQILAPATDEDHASTPLAVRDLLADPALAVADVDNTELGLALIGASGRGQWQFRVDGGAWTNLPAVAADQALLLPETADLRYLPDGLHGEVAGLEFLPWDRSLGTDSASGRPQLADPRAPELATAFASLSSVLTLAVAEVNDAPAAAGGPVAVQEDQAATLTLAHFGYADPDGNALLRVWFDTLPAAGTLVLDGNPLAPGQAVAAADIAAGHLQYLPPADANGSGLAQIAFRVQDDGGTERAGSDTATHTGLLRLDVAAVNDAPRFVDGRPLVVWNQAENQEPVLTVAATDVDNETLRYRIAGGADAALFRIDEATGALQLLLAPDFEAPADADRDNIYQVQVVADDGDLQTLQTLHLHVSDENEAPVWRGPDRSVVADNSTAALVLSASDPDAGTTALRYLIVGGADASRFAIDAGTGALSFVEPMRYLRPQDADGNNVYEVLVEVSDGERSVVRGVSVVIAPPTLAPGAPGTADAAQPAVPADTDRPDLPPAASANATGPAAPTARLPNGPAAAGEPTAAAETAELALTPAGARSRGLGAPVETARSAALRAAGFTVPISPIDQALAELLSSVQAKAQNALDPLLLNTLVAGRGGRDGETGAGDAGAGADDDTWGRLRAGAVQAEVAAAVLGAGFVWWSLRAAGLLATVLASAPVWRHLDPIPILGGDDEERRGPGEDDPADDEAARDEAASRELLEQVRRTKA